MSFDTYLAGFAGDQLQLPLVHNTTCKRFREIANKGVLEPRSCDKFKEPLVYFFYGRPIYRSNTSGNVADTGYTFCPVCLVLRPNSQIPIARLFPFDSGAAASGLFAPLIPSEHRDRYSLVATVATARRLVEAFFETNQQYYVGKARPFFNSPPTEPEVGQYWTLVSTEGEAEYDDRRSAIELQTREVVPLTNTVQAVILPKVFLDEASLRKILVQDWGAVPLTYHTSVGGIPNEYTRVISEKLVDFLEDSM
jgi:hypothetical protein